MSAVINVNFGSAEERIRSKLADALLRVSEHIRNGEIKNEPTGFILFLKSSNGLELLNAGVTTGDFISVRDRMREEINKSQ
jgi:hypothetical protein